MPERVVKVSLVLAATGYMQGMDEAARKTREMGSEAEKLAQKKDSLNALGVAAVGFGAAAAAGVGVAVSRFADFDAAMSAVQASTHETSGNMALLRQAALDAGEGTVYSATEAAGAIEELAKAGVSTADILGGGLAGSLDLAAAGEMQVADAAGVAATALQMFNLKGNDMAHVADLLAAGAGKAMGDVSDMAQALNQAGLVANQTGLSIEETTAGLAAFAEQGMLGSDAGTSFKAMLQRLTPQSDEAAKLMNELGISAYDAGGNFIGLAKFAGNLQGAMEDLTPQQRNSAMATIFGSDAVRAAGVIYRQGEEGIRKWTEAVDDQGYAAETARQRLDNLKGDVEALGGALDTALIQTGSAANDALRGMTQALTGLVGMYNELPQGVQGAVMAVGATTAAVGLSGGAALLAVPKWVEFKRAVEGVGWTMKGVGITAGLAGLAIGGVVAVVGTLAAEHAKGAQRAQAYADTLEDGTRRITEATRELVQEDLGNRSQVLWWQDSSIYDAAEKMGVSLDLVTDAALGNAEAFAEVKAKAEEWRAAQTGGREELEGYDNTVNKLVGGIERVNGELGTAADLERQKTEATKESTAASENAAETYLDEANAVMDLTSEVMKLVDAMNEANGVGLDANAANIEYQNTLREVEEQVKNVTAGVEGFGTGIDAATQAGADNREMLLGLASDSQRAAEAQFNLDGNTQAYIESLKEGRQRLIDSARAMGASEDAAKALADQVYRIPSQKEIDILADTSAAQKAIDTYIYKNSGREIIVKIGTSRVAQGSGGSGGITRAHGGPVYGPGTETSDSIPAWLSNGEHVITAKEVRAMGGHAAVEKWRAMATSGASLAVAAMALPRTPEGPELIIVITTDNRKRKSMSAGFTQPEMEGAR